MKVVENGPDIPDELIAAQERGQTLFICGAGVSLGAGLPTFRGLVAGVYEHLHEQWQHHHAEREGMENGGRLYGQYDRVLRCLERRLGGPNPQRNRRMRSRIRSAVRARLQPPPAPDLSNHLALFDLSCDEVGNSRILTTNFDTLFERAAKSSRGTPPPSHSGVGLPQPKSPNFSGVLHLHGRLADADLNLEETDLVLTSAEFGDAYLRTGWASRYVYDLVRTHTVVLVGYQADDPPMRYLLEALEADRERYVDLKRVYAFAPSDPGEETLESELWRAKGVEPIIYRKDGDDHSKLYVSLREWQSYAMDPTLWRHSRLQAIFANALETTDESVRNECVRLLSHHDASELLGVLSPDPEWLPFLTSKGVFKPSTTHLGLWAASRIAEPEMIRQVAGSPVLDDTSRWHLERALEKTNPDLKDVFRRAWRLIIRESIASAAPLSRHGWLDIEPRLKLGEVGYSERATITGIFKPQLRVEKPYRFREEQEDTEHHSLRTLVRIDFTSGDYPHSGEVLSALPSQPEIERELLLSLDRALSESLEEAYDVGFLDGWDAANGDVPSVAPHTQNTYRSGFYPIVRMMADLWLRLAASDPSTARTIAMRWAEGRWPLIKRLWLFAAESDLFSPDEVADALLKTHDNDFWVSNAVVEVMRAVTSRWDALPAEKRALIETRIRDGVPRALYMDGLEEDRWGSIHDSSIFRRLSRLKAARCQLSDESEARLTEIVAVNPQWQAGEGDRDDFNSWSESSSGPEGDPQQLSVVPDEELVAEAKRLRREDRHGQGDVWRMFAASDPERALRGLLADAENGVWESAEWRDLINVAVQVELGKFQTELALAILNTPAKLFEEQQARVASWLRARRALLIKEGAANSYFAIWDRLADIAYLEPGTIKPGEEKDLMFEALNRSSGILAWTILEQLGSTSPTKGAGLGTLQGRFDMLIAAKGRAGIVARLLLAESIAYLYQTDPLWTEANMVPRFDWRHAEAPYMWHGYARGHLGNAELFASLKEDLLLAFDRNELSDDDLDNLAGNLVSVAFWHQNNEGLEYTLSSAEIKRAIATGTRSVRRHASWQLWRSMMDKPADPALRASHWTGILKPIFESIWPLDARLREEESSQNLVRMAQESGPAFPDAVDTILDFVVPYQLYDLAHSMRLTRDLDGLIEKYPKAVLLLTDALVDPAVHAPPRGISKLLSDCEVNDPDVRSTESYRRLKAISRLANQ